MISHKDNLTGCLTEGKGGSGKILQKTSLKALRPKGMILQVENGVVLPGSALNQIENEMIPQVETGIVLQRSALNQIENDMTPRKDNFMEGKRGSGKIPQTMNLKVLRLERMLLQVENDIVLQKNALNLTENDMIHHKDNVT